jgi:hypothetical protein
MKQFVNIENWSWEGFLEIWCIIYQRGTKDVDIMDMLFHIFV